MIDTKFIRMLSNSSDGVGHENVSDMCDELDRLYHDTTPLTREELEEALSKSGIAVRMQDSGCFDYTTKGGVVFSLSDECETICIIDIPLSVVTTALLNSLLEAK